MGRLSNVFRDARSKAKLTEEMMASMVGLDESRVRRLEAGEVEPSPYDLDAYAQVFGVRMQEFVQGVAGQAPMTSLLFRSCSTEVGLAGLQRLVAAEAHKTIGEFMRCVRDVAELRGLLGQEGTQRLPSAPKELLVEIDGPPPHGGDRLAAWFRAELGLGSEPIASMKTLVVERLGVDVFWVTPEELDPVIDGASTDSPSRAILVNLVEGPQCWWRTRMTLGHELCHLLCDDSEETKRFAIFSPHVHPDERPGWNLFEGFDRLERRSSAFAACLLAPDEAVKRIVGLRDPTSEEAIMAIGKELGLGRTTAINRLQRVFRLNRQVRIDMAARSARHWLSTRHADQAPDSIGLRGGILEMLALSAYAEGRIDALRVREYLRLPLTESLPEHPQLTEPQRSPIRRVEDRVRAVAQRDLLDAGSDSWELFIRGVAPGEGGWKVEVEGRRAESSAPLAPCGELLVSYDLARVERRLAFS